MISNRDKYALKLRQEWLVCRNLVLNLLLERDESRGREGGGVGTYSSGMFDIADKNYEKSIKREQKNNR